MKYTPFWRDDAAGVAPRLDTAVPDRVDVAVVGAGYTGLNAARVLARSGAAVAVLDAGPVGNGASSVNGGMVNYGLKRSTRAVFSAYGPELGRHFWDAALRSIDLVEEVVKDEGIDCSFTRGGAAELGYRDRDLRSFAARRDWLRDTVDFEMELVEAGRIAAVVDSTRFRAALVDRVGAGLHPARYVYGLAGVLARRGVTVVEHAPVTSIARTTAGYQLLTPRGKVTAGTVLLATNGYTGPLVPALQRRVVPVGSYIVVTEPLPAAMAERLIPHNRMLWTSRRFLNYFRRTPDDRILMGGRNDLSTDLDLDESARLLRATSVDIFPELDDVAFTHTWTGRLGITFDLMPHIGRIDGMWYALGYGGHGVGIGTLVGNEVGRLISGELATSPFAAIDHPERFYYRGRAWFLPAAARWYRFLDAIGR